MTDILSEKDLILSLKASVAIQAENDALDLFVQIANVYIARGQTQEGADILAYILQRENSPDDIINSAEELWDDLARWICPRVLYDAEIFGRKAYFEDIVEYILAGI